ncbi:MAG TPA: YraN family protein [Edaphobacter sp.]|nr:YraN family protein [Edaphobacter sp.]
MVRTLAGSTLWIDMQAFALRRIELLGRRFGRRRRLAEHLATGERGEREALFHLRKHGYIVVARRWRTPKLRGDIDLIAWENDWLCFIEVKTRSERDAMSPAEAAVDDDKKRMLRRMARVYLRSFPERSRREIPVRFDVISVYLESDQPEFDLYRGVFGWE